MSWMRFHLATTLNRAPALFALAAFLVVHFVLGWVLLTAAGWPALLILIVTVPLVGGLSEVGVRRVIQWLIGDAGRLWHRDAPLGGTDIGATEKWSGMDERERRLFEAFLAAAVKYGSEQVRQTAIRTLEARRRNQSTTAIKKPS